MLYPALLNDTFGLCYALPLCYKLEVCDLLCFTDRVVCNLNVLCTFSGIRYLSNMQLIYSSKSIAVVNKTYKEQTVCVYTCHYSYYM